MMVQLDRAFAAVPPLRLRDRLRGARIIVSQTIRIDLLEIDIALEVVANDAEDAYEAIQDTFRWAFSPGAQRPKTLVSYRLLP